MPIPRKFQEILKLNRFPITHETLPNESPYAAEDLKNSEIQLKMAIGFAAM